MRGADASGARDAWVGRVAGPRELMPRGSLRGVVLLSLGGFVLGAIKIAEK